LVGGWHVIIDLLNSVPLSMNPRAVIDSIGQAANGVPQHHQHHQHSFKSHSDDDHREGGGGGAYNSGTGSIGARVQESSEQQQQQQQQQSSHYSTTSSLMSSSLSIIPQYQWPLETLSSSFNCMKLIVDEFLEAVMPNCELVSGLLQGLALFASQVSGCSVLLVSDNDADDVRWMELMNDAVALDGMCQYALVHDDNDVSVCSDP